MLTHARRCIGRSTCHDHPPIAGAVTQNAGMDVASWICPRLSKWLERWGDLGCEYLLAVSLDGDLPPADPPAGVALRLATPEDIDAVIRLYANDPWLYLGDWAPVPGDTGQIREMYLDRLRRGELCFMAMSGDEIVHVNWSCYRWGDLLPDQPFRLRAGEVYTTDAVTVPAFRGRGLHAFVLRSMLAHAKALGMRLAYAQARVDRNATWKALFQVGFRKQGRLIYFLPRGGARPWFLSRRGNLEPLFRAA